MMEPLGHISEYGLEKLRTRRHYCVSVSHQPEKEYTIGIVRLSDAEARISELRQLAQHNLDWGNQAIADMKAAEARAEAAEARIAELEAAADQYEAQATEDDTGAIWRYWRAKAESAEARVKELEAAKWQVRHADTANDLVSMGMARDAAEARVKELERERDAAFAMSKCECGEDEACRNLADLRRERDLLAYHVAPHTDEEFRSSHCAEQIIDAGLQGRQAALTLAIPVLEVAAQRFSGAKEALEAAKAAMEGKT